MSIVLTKHLSHKIYLVVTKSIILSSVTNNYNLKLNLSLNLATASDASEASDVAIDGDVNDTNINNLKYEKNNNHSVNALMLNILSSNNVEKKLIELKIFDESFKQAMYMLDALIRLVICVVIAAGSNIILVFGIIFWIITRDQFRPYFPILLMIDQITNAICLLFQFSFGQHLYKKYFHCCDHSVKRLCLQRAANISNHNNNNNNNNYYSKTTSHATKEKDYKIAISMAVNKSKQKEQESISNNVNAMNHDKDKNNTACSSLNSRSPDNNDLGLPFSWGKRNIVNSVSNTQRDEIAPPLPPVCNGSC